VFQDDVDVFPAIASRRPLDAGGQRARHHPVGSSPSVRGEHPRIADAVGRGPQRLVVLGERAPRSLDDGLDVVDEQPGMVLPDLVPVLQRRSENREEERAQHD
jgi:hypothetical protein